MLLSGDTAAQRFFHEHNFEGYRRFADILEIVSSDRTRKNIFLLSNFKLTVLSAQKDFIAHIEMGNRYFLGFSNFGIFGRGRFQESSSNLGHHKYYGKSGFCGISQERKSLWLSKIVKAFFSEQGAL